MFIEHALTSRFGLMLAPGLGGFDKQNKQKDVSASRAPASNISGGGVWQLRWLADVSGPSKLHS